MHKPTRLRYALCSVVSVRKGSLAATTPFGELKELGEEGGGGLTG